MPGLFRTLEVTCLNSVELNGAVYGILLDSTGLILHTSNQKCKNRTLTSRWERTCTHFRTPSYPWWPHEILLSRVHTRASLGGTCHAHSIATTVKLTLLVLIHDRMAHLIHGVHLIHSAHLIHAIHLIRIQLIHLVHLIHLMHRVDLIHPVAWVVHSSSSGSHVTLLVHAVASGIAHAHLGIRIGIAYNWSHYTTLIGSVSILLPVWKRLKYKWRRGEHRGIFM